MEGVISSKTIKVQTTLPNAYLSQNPGEMALIDVPCFCMPPDKKWSVLEYKITVNMMMNCAKKVGFVFFVDEKNTRTNVTSWKKTFYGWVELFK